MSDERARLEAAVVAAALAERRTWLKVQRGEGRYVNPAAAEIALQVAVDALLAYRDKEVGDE